MADVNDEKHETLASSIEFKIMAGGVGAPPPFLVQKLTRPGGKQIPGQDPPDPDDPEASTVAAVAWVAASAVGVAVVQVLARRLAANRYAVLGRKQTPTQ
mgnify:CR=1 FL=1